MSAFLTEAQVKKLFRQAKASPIDDGLKELRKVMYPSRASEVQHTRVVHRVVLTNGTRKAEQGESYAELERGTY